jgi:hypothetical protein
MEEPEDLGLQTKHMITKTTKKRWGHCALLIEFAPRQYPRVSNYPMISKIRRISGATVIALGLFASSENIGRN